MTSYLLDTHVLLWALDNYEQLSQSTQNTINNPQNTLLISDASLWEIATKIKIGKLPLHLQTLIATIENSDYKMLPITTKHITTTLTLPLHHNDPFDRLLIAQATAENITLISSDKIMDKYDIRAISA